MASMLLSEKVLKILSFCQKLKILYISDNTIGFKFLQHVVQYVSNNEWRDFSLSVSAFASVVQKTFNCKFSEKTEFPTEHFMLLLLTLTS